MACDRDWFDWSGWVVGQVGFFLTVGALIWQERQHRIAQAKSDREKADLTRQLQELQRTSGATHEIVTFDRPDPPRSATEADKKAVYELVRRSLGGDGSVSEHQVLEWSIKNKGWSAATVQGAISELVEEGMLRREDGKLRVLR